MMKIFKFPYSINLTLIALVVLLMIPNQSCKQNDDIIEQVPAKLAPQVESAIVNIVSIVKQNAATFAAIYNEAKQATSNGDLALRSEDFDVLDPATENGIREFEKDPERILRLIAAEPQGAEKIALLEGLFAIKDGQTLKKLYAPFGTIPDMPDYNASGSNVLESRRECSLDCRLHWMAGASIATGVSSIAFITLGRLQFWLKVALSVAAGCAMTLWAAHAREAYNNRQIPGSYDHRDLRNTIWGGGIASPVSVAITWGLLKMRVSRTITVISMGVVSAILGYCPMMTLVTGIAPSHC
jgi:hypothetical protein